MLVQDGMFLDQNDELYNQLVPKNNKLRKLSELTDFSFIYTELKDNYCLDNGRHATSPVLLFKYLILKIIFSLSDVDVVERTRYDLSFKFFLELHPMETNLINPATLTKFRKKRLKDSELLNKLLNESVKIAHKHNLIKSDKVIVDSTHTGAMYNFKSPRDILIDESKKLRKAVYQYQENYKELFPTKPSNSGILEDYIDYCEELLSIIEKDELLLTMPNVSERYNYLKELIEDNLENIKQSKDEDAKIGHKTFDTNFFGYKTHIAITPERFVVAATVTSGEKPDGKELQELIRQSKNNGINVKEVIGDGAYSELDNLEYAKENDIKLISKLSKTVVSGNKSKNPHRDDFRYNKDADTYICPAGHKAIRKTKCNIKHNGKVYENMTYMFDVEKCKRCCKKGCYKEGSKSKSFTVALKKDIFKDHMNFMKSKEFKEKAKERYKVEAINAHLKNNYDYRVANSRGLFGMEVQAATTLFVSNLERIIKLMH